MRRIKYSLAVFATLFLSGCTQELIVDTRPADYEKSNQPIKLYASYTKLTATTDTGVSTRAPYMGEIGDNGPFEARVFASLHATSFQNEFSLGRTMTFADQGNAQTTAVGYSTPIYYPLNNTQQVRLSGFYPHTSWGLIASGGYNVFQASIDGKSDLMASEAVLTDIDDAYSSPTTFKNLPFTHALTLLDLNVKAKDASMIDLWGDITSIEVVGVVYDTENLLPSTAVTWDATNSIYDYINPAAAGSGIPSFVYDNAIISGSKYTNTPISDTNAQPLTETLTQIGYVLVPPVRVDKTAIPVDFGYQLKITTTNKPGPVEVFAKITLDPLNPIAGDDTRGKVFPVELTFGQQATFYRIPIPADFLKANGDSEAQYTTKLSELLTTRTYIVYDPLDLDDSDGKRRIAEIDLEYVKGGDETKPVVVVYEMEYSISYPNGRRKMTGTIANDGTHVNWSNTNITKDHLVIDPYDEGHAAGGNYDNLHMTASPVTPFLADECFYYNPAGNGGQGQILYSNSGGTVTDDIVPAPYLFTDWEGKTYPVVKIGTQYFTASNLRTSTYPDGGTISASDFGMFSTLPGYSPTLDIDGNSLNNAETFGNYYSLYVSSSSHFTPYNGWDAMSGTDNAVFIGYLDQDEGAPKTAYSVISAGMMIELGNPTWWLTPTNISGFSMIWTRSVFNLSNVIQIAGAGGGASDPSWWLSDSYSWNGTYSGLGYMGASDGSMLNFPADDPSIYYPIRLVINNYLPDEPNGP